MAWLDRVPWWVTILLAATIGLAPFSPQPHIVEKLVMLTQGRLLRPIDVFDLVVHAAPWLLLALKLGGLAAARMRQR